MSVKGLVLCLALVVLSSLYMSAAASAESLFVLNGSAREDVDPQDGQIPINQFVSINSVATPGSISRNYGANTSIKVKDFDSMLQVKYFLGGGLAKICGAGSPRFEMRIDVDGAGPRPPANALGYLGEGSGSCPFAAWTFEDMTNASPKWDVSQFTASPSLLTWDQMEIYFQTNYPGHGVHAVSLVELSSLTPPFVGCSWYDNLTIKQNTLDDHGDSAGVGGRCVPPVITE